MSRWRIPIVLGLAILTVYGNAIGEKGTASAISQKEGFEPGSLLLGAHRGGRRLWPENTVLAYREAAERWPQVLLEGDLNMSADGQVVVIHDRTLNRTTDGEGLVKEKTLAELEALDAAYWFTQDDGKTYPYRGKGVTIPRLGEALAAAPRHRFLFELKDGYRIAEATVEAIQKAGAQHRTILASVSPVLMQRVRELDPEIRTCYDYNQALKMLDALRRGDWAAYTPTDAMLCISTEIEERFSITPAEVQAIQAKGILCLYFTVNRPDEMRALLERNVDSILTDCPDVLAEVMAETRNTE